MENLYEILQSHPEATTEELRKAYTKLVRIFHPDKSAQQTNSTGGESYSESCSSSKPKESANTFVKIDKAWKILSNQELRSQFDVKWKERCLAQELPIQDVVPFLDFEFDECDRIHSYPCRCGGEYILSEMDIELCFDLVCCETCSLTVRIVYDDS